jgi:hypothetical protein
VWFLLCIRYRQHTAKQHSAKLTTEYAAKLTTEYAAKLTTEYATKPPCKFIAGLQRYIRNFQSWVWLMCNLCRR